jgi:VanZ family protein
MTVVNEIDDLHRLPKHPTHPRRLWLAASAAWTGLILFSSTSIAAEYSERAFASLYGSIVRKHLAPEEAFDRLHFLAEKGLHLTLFFVLGILLWRVFVAARWRRVGAVVLSGLIVGTASELLQGFFPGRDPAIRDVLINMAGSFIGAAASLRRE